MRLSIENYKPPGMKRLLTLLALIVPAGGAVHANDAPEPTTNTSAQAQARQFGIFFGGTASQYDLCVKKGFLPKGDQSAEEIAKSFLEKTWRTNQGADQSAFVQDGWNTMKKEISENESFYTLDRCASVGKQWTKLLMVMRKK
jgi:opacity protein-like surface antigen